jgi:hypothetical protein
VWEGWRREASPYPDQSPHESNSEAFGIICENKFGAAGLETCFVSGFKRANSARARQSSAIMLVPFISQIEA